MGYLATSNLAESALLISALVLSGCGGSGETKSTITPPVIVAPPAPEPVPEPQPEECVNQVYSISKELGTDPRVNIVGDKACVGGSENLYCIWC